MKLRPFTEKEQKFADQNHELIYSFLNEKELAEEDYYDIVIFGFLKAVQEFCSNPFRYKCFSTLAWKCMSNELINYYQHKSRKKRHVAIVSFDDIVNKVNDYEENAIIYDEYINELKMNLLMHELARRLPEREMRIVKMKVRGDKLQDIARAERLNFQQIGRMIDDIYPAVIKIIYE